MQSECFPVAFGLDVNMVYNAEELNRWTCCKAPVKPLLFVADLIFVEQVVAAPTGSGKTGTYLFANA